MAFFFSNAPYEDGISLREGQAFWKFLFLQAYWHYSINIQRTCQGHLVMNKRQLKKTWLAISSTVTQITCNPWWVYIIDVTPSNLKPSNLYSSNHHLAFERRYLSTYTSSEKNWLISSKRHQIKEWEQCYICFDYENFCYVLPNFRSWKDGSPTSSDTHVTQSGSNVYLFHQIGSTHPKHCLTHDCINQKEGIWHNNIQIHSSDAPYKGSGSTRKWESGKRVSNTDMSKLQSNYALTVIY